MCAVNWVHEDGDICFQLGLDPVEKELVMNSVEICHGIFGQWGEKETAAFQSSMEGQKDEVTVTVDKVGFHVSLDGMVSHVFAHRKPWSSDALVGVEVDFSLGNYAEVVEMPADAQVMNDGTFRNKFGIDPFHCPPPGTRVSRVPWPSDAEQTIDAETTSVSARANEVGTPAGTAATAAAATSKPARGKQEVAASPANSTPLPTEPSPSPTTPRTPTTATQPPAAVTSTTVTSESAAASSKAVRWARRVASAQSAPNNATLAAPAPSTSVQVLSPESTSASARYKTWAFRSQCNLIFHMQFQHLQNLPLNEVQQMLKNPVFGESKMARWSQRALASKSPPKYESVADAARADQSWTWKNVLWQNAQAVAQPTKSSKIPETKPSKIPVYSLMILFSCSRLPISGF
jgi:hypothetical protein